MTKQRKKQNSLVEAEWESKTKKNIVIDSGTSEHIVCNRLYSEDVQKMLLALVKLAKLYEP